VGGDEYLSEQDALEKADELANEGLSEGEQRESYSVTSFKNLFASRNDEFKRTFQRHPREKDLYRMKRD